ncbi:MAG: exopolysaccharide biosynthesis polyprenyl glycosylphosphotransferase [Opitutales bacterium]|nr:exopolysaccharide biosynthesis polyprenyl glycosylphosphotransferase [Opitutales bacterium]
MIQNRLKGTQMAITLCKMGFLPLWFLLLTVLFVEFSGMMVYDQVTFEIYMLGAAAAFFLRFKRPDFLFPGGPDRHHWVRAAQESNRETLILAGVTFAIVYATKDKAISRQFIAFFLISSWFVIFLLNRWLPLFLSRTFFKGNARMQTLLVGSPERIEQLGSWIEQQEGIGIKVVGFVNYTQDDAGPTRFRFLGLAKDLGNILREHQIQQVILLETRNSRPWIQRVLDTCTEKGCRLIIYNSWQDLCQQPLIAFNEGNHAFYTLKDEPLQNPMNRIAKRLVDVAIALPVCLFVLPPLALWVKIMQWFQSPGPLLFSQKRTGVEQVPFAIYKFRSMHANLERDATEAKQAEFNDSRIYPFGRFLRRTSLDEFPQFFNVLKGEMSIVGPRPHLIAHDEAFARQMKVYRDRHFAKPGITGLAQNRGYRGEIRSPEEIQNRIELDLDYIHHWSLWLDLGIIIRTFWQVFRPPPSAY